VYGFWRGIKNLEGHDIYPDGFSIDTFSMYYLNLITLNSVYLEMGGVIINIFETVDIINV